jgi:hypothetical protein
MSPLCPAVLPLADTAVLALGGALYEPPPAPGAAELGAS